jgi:hypothetical protein
MSTFCPGEKDTCCSLLQGAQTEYACTWAASVHETGEYRVGIVRRAPYCDPAVTYLLTLAVRQ